MSSDSVGRSAWLSAVKRAPAPLVTLLTAFPKSNAQNFHCIGSSTESAFQDGSWGAGKVTWPLRNELPSSVARSARTQWEASRNWPLILSWKTRTSREGMKPAAKVSCGLRTRGSWKPSLDAVGESLGILTGALGKLPRSQLHWCYSRCSQLSITKDFSHKWCPAGRAHCH